MATQLTPVDILLAGVLDGPVAADVAGNSFLNTGYEFAEIVNGGGSPITVTATAYPAGGQAAPYGLSFTSPTVTVAAGARKLFGPFPKTAFNDATKKVNLTYSAVTSVTVEIFRLTPVT